MAAPTSSCFFSSFEARGKLLLFLRSVRAISATSSSFSLTIGSLPEGVSGGERKEIWSEVCHNKRKEKAGKKEEGRVLITKLKGEDSRVRDSE